MGGWRDIDLKQTRPDLENIHKDEHHTQNVEGGVWRWGKYVQNGAYHCYSNYTHPTAVHRATAFLEGVGIADANDRKVANPGYAAGAHVSLPDISSRYCHTYYWVN